MERGRTARKTSERSIVTKMALPIMVRLMPYDHPISHRVTMCCRWCKDRDKVSLPGAQARVE